VIEGIVSLQEITSDLLSFRHGNLSNVWKRY
jgi:hypothetical protein